MDKETRVWESLVVLIVIVLSLTAWLVSAGFPKGDNGIVGPALFPRVLGVILLTSSVVVLFNSWRPAIQAASARPATQAASAELVSNARFDWPKLARVGALLLALAFTPLLLAQFGLLITSVVLTVGVCLLLGSRWFEALIAGGVMLGFVYAVFIQLLKVQA